MVISLSGLVPLTISFTSGIGRPLSKVKAFLVGSVFPASSLSGKDSKNRRNSMAVIVAKCEGVS